MDIIFGPLHQQHIKPLADFADKHDIRLVIPFTSKEQYRIPQSVGIPNQYSPILPLFGSVRPLCTPVSQRQRYLYRGKPGNQREGGLHQGIERGVAQPFHTYKITERGCYRGVLESRTACLTVKIYSSPLPEATSH